MIKNFNITKVVMIFAALVVLVNAGANIVLDNPEIIFKAEDDFSNGVMINGSNSGWCAGDIKSVDFSNPNSPFSYEGIDLPYTVDAGGKFSLKILYNGDNQESREELRDTLILELDFEFKCYFPIIYTSKVTPVVNISAEKIFRVSYSVNQGKINFNFHESGVFSALLVSGSGRTVAELAKSVSVSAGNDFTSALNMNNLSSGTYFLRTSFKENGKAISNIQKLNHMKE